jgi:malate permease and related proteins
MDLLLGFQRLIPIFESTLLPVLLVAAAGYLLATFVPLDGRTLGRFLFFLATPSLVFRSLYHMTVDMAALGHIAVITVGVLVIGMVLGWYAGAGQTRRNRSGLVLASAIGNNGNMGIPICLFAFGEPGVALATVYYAVSSFLSNTVGVVVASAGSARIVSALTHALRAPVLYAAVLGLLFNQWQVTIPDSLERSIDLLSGAAVPGMLVLLGAQLRATKFGGQHRIVWRAVVIRLIVSPFVAWGLCTLLGISGLERQVLIVQAAMPTAVMTTVLATEYDAAPHLVAAAVLATTLLSMVTLSIVLALMQV